MYERLSNYILVCGTLLVMAGVGATEEDSTMTQTVEIEGLVAAPAEAVFAAWTTSEGLESWLAAEARVELRLDGPYEIFFAPDAPEGQRGSEKCRVLSYSPNRMLSMSWNAPPSIPDLRKLGPCTWVVVDFIPEGDAQTRLKISHLGIGQAGDWDRYREYFESAWPNVLKACQNHFSADS